VATRHVKSNLAVLTIASLLLFANSVPASGADPERPPCRTAAQFDPANFPNPPKIDNQWNPLAAGMQFVLAEEANRGKGQTHRVVSTVTDLTKVVNGVTAVVILETGSSEGVLQGSKLAFQAQDNVGNLWNLGEFPAEFDDNGKFKEAPDTWISGLLHAEPGNLMVSNPQLGTPEYLQGWSPDIGFLVCAKVYKMQQTTCVPVGCYDNVLITDQRSPLKPESGHQRKYYAPGVGNVRASVVDDPGEETLVLVKVSQLSPEDLAKVRQEALELEKTAYKVNDLYRQTQPVESTGKNNTNNNTDKSTSTDDGLAWVPFGPKDPTFPTPTWPTYNFFAEGKCSKLRDYLTTDGAGIAQSDLAQAMVAVCAAAIEGQQDQWSVAEGHAGADLSGIGDDCLGAAVKELLDRALAWHKQHPGRTPVVQIQRVEGRTECGKRYPPDEPPPTTEEPPPTTEEPPPTTEEPPPTTEEPLPTPDEPTETTG
jgi:hypothetical protein